LDLIPQDHRVDTVPALDATEDFGIMFAGVNQVVAPVMYEQA